MIRAIIATLGLAFAVQAHASSTTVFDVINAQQRLVIMDQAHTQALNWKVGDESDFSVDMGFLKGTMVMKCRDITADGLWVDQDVDLGMAGKQQMSMLLDPNTGAVKKLLVNGQEQAPPKQNISVIDVKQDNITVPAGTFDCVHARLKDNDNNGAEINTWLNPQLIPLSGMLKTIQPSQYGDVTIELTSFKKN